MFFAKSVLLRMINNIVLGIYLNYKAFLYLLPITTHLPNECVWHGSTHITGSL